MSFVADLTWKDLQRLRAVVQRVHKEKMTRRGKKYTPMPLRQVDEWIEAMGPKVREKRIKLAVDRGFVE